MDVLTRSRTQSLILGGVALGALSLVGFAIIASGRAAQAPDRIAFGITLVLTLTATVVAWGLAAKRAQLPSWIAIATLGWGVFVARMWVPTAPISLLFAVAGIAELVIVGWTLTRVRAVVRTARASRDKRLGRGRPARGAAASDLRD
jgi:hypothetical protein